MRVNQPSRKDCPSVPIDLSSTSRAPSPRVDTYVSPLFWGRAEIDLRTPIYGPLEWIRKFEHHALKLDLDDEHKASHARWCLRGQAAAYFSTTLPELISEDDIRTMQNLWSGPKGFRRRFEDEFLTNAEAADLATAWIVPEQQRYEMEKEFFARVRNEIGITLSTSIADPTSTTSARDRNATLTTEAARFSTTTGKALTQAIRNEFVSRLVDAISRPIYYRGLRLSRTKEEIA